MIVHVKSRNYQSKLEDNPSRFHRSSFVCYDARGVGCRTLRTPL